MTKPKHVNRMATDMPAMILADAVRIDTRLVAAVQRRAGARVHEAAGFLHAYYLWANLLARAERVRDESMISTASPQVNASRARLRRFLTEPCQAAA